MFILNVQTNLRLAETVLVHVLTWVHVWKKLMKIVFFMSVFWRETCVVLLSFFFSAEVRLFDSQLIFWPFFRKLQKMRTTKIERMEFYFQWLKSIFSKWKKKFSRVILLTFFLLFFFCCYSSFLMFSPRSFWRIKFALKKNNRCEWIFFGVLKKLFNGFLWLQRSFFLYLLGWELG